MVYFSKSEAYISQTEIVIRIVFCICMTSYSIHICKLTQHSMSTCRQNKHRWRNLVEAKMLSQTENSMQWHCLTMQQ